jgi:predicted alpha/beta hydrolase family esterase
MHDIITLPGLGGSAETHWQTLWERNDTRFTRFQPASWDRPELADWEQSLEQAVGRCAKPPVLVAHSLACLLVAHWATRFPSTIAGAFLVAVPDPDGANFPAEAAAFCWTPSVPAFRDDAGTDGLRHRILRIARLAKAASLG